MRALSEKFYRLLKILLFPFSLLYGFVVFIRNKFYDWGIYKSIEFDIPVISVGNLSAGGTGKTPMMEYLIMLLNEFYKIGTLSRGYKRKTTGYLSVKEDSTAEQVGDEPLQLKRKFSSIPVAVSEDRMMAIPEMLYENAELQVILMDDAFQHRSVKPGLSILLTPFESLFYKDWLLPSGRLRESRSGATRADVIAVTRSPEQITEAEKSDIRRQIQCYSSAPVYFSSLYYGKLHSLFNSTVTYPQTELAGTQVLLLCGIAHPAPLISYLNSQDCKVHPMVFPDHYYFREKDLNHLFLKWNAIHAEKKIIITTEKDAARLMGFKDRLTEYHIEIWVLPVEHKFSEDDKNQFNKLIFDFLKKSNSANKAR